MLILARFIVEWISGQGRWQWRRCRVFHTTSSIFWIFTRCMESENLHQRHELSPGYHRSRETPRSLRWHGSFYRFSHQKFHYPEVPADWEYRDELEAFREGRQWSPLGKTQCCRSDYASELDREIIVMSFVVSKSTKQQDSQRKYSVKRQRVRMISFV